MPVQHGARFFIKHYDSQCYGVKRLRIGAPFFNRYSSFKCPARRLSITCFAPVVESSNSPCLYFSSPTLHFRNSASVMAFGAGVGRRFLGAILPATIWAPPHFALLTIFCEASFTHNLQGHTQHLADIGPTGLLSMGMHPTWHGTLQNVQFSSPGPRVPGQARDSQTALSAAS